MKEFVRLPQAYMGVDGRIRMFRPDKNMDRLARSAQRLNLPDFDNVNQLAIVYPFGRIYQAPCCHSIFLAPSLLICSSLAIQCTMEGRKSIVDLKADSFTDQRIDFCIPPPPLDGIASYLVTVLPAFGLSSPIFGFCLLKRERRIVH